MALGHRHLPPAAQRTWGDMGLMAAKEIEATGLEFADALMKADCDFKHAC